MTGIEKKLTELEGRQADKLPPLRIIWINTGEKPPAHKPGDWVIYWGAGRPDNTKSKGG